MFLANALRSKLASLLRPWLEEEPEMELKLGFLRSSVSLKNLTFSPSSLDPFIKDSTKLEFREVKVGEIIVQISPWSFPSLILEVRGVDVHVAPRELVEARRESPKDFAARKKKEVMATLDPEGVSLHEKFETILFRATSGNWLAKTMANVMLRCLSLKFKEINILLLFVNDACMWKVDGFSLKSQFLYRSSLFRGFFGSLLISDRESALAIDCNCMEFGQRKTDRGNWITSLMGLSARVILNNNQPLDYDVQITQVNFEMSPSTIPVILVLLDVLLSKKVAGARSGLELWNIAAERMCPRSLTARLCLFKAVNLVLQWAHYVRAYTSLLSLIGYSANQNMKQNLATVSSDRKLMSLVKHQLRRIYNLEEKLPAEAVVCARRIARERTFFPSSIPDLEPTTGFMLASLSKIVALFLPFWKVICLIFLPVLQFLFMGNVSSSHQRINAHLPLLVGASADHFTELQFSLSLAEIHITLSHASTDHGIIYRKRDGAAKPCDLTALFCFTMRCLCVNYSVDISTTSLFLALGEFKLCLSSLSRVSHVKNDMRGIKSPSFRGPKVDAGDESHIIMWGDAALQPSDAVSHPLNIVEKALFFTLKSSVGNLWSYWNKVRRKYEEFNGEHNIQPFLLFELRKPFLYPYTRVEGCGLPKCSLALGKLTFDLEHSSIMSITLLFKQMQIYHQWATSLGRVQNPHISSVTVENSQPEGEDRLNFYANRLKVAMLNIIPDKNIQVGAHISGPSMRISSRGATVSPTINHDYCFSLDIENIEFFVWPASKAILAQLSGESIFNEAAIEYLWLKEPQIVDVMKPHIDAQFFCQGRSALNASLRLNGITIMVDDLELNQQTLILEPMSITLQCSTSREYVHSLPARVNILSVAISGLASGAVALFVMDELWTFFQILDGISTVVSSACNAFEFVILGYSQEFIRKLSSQSHKDRERNTSISEAILEAIIGNDTRILVDATLELGTVNIILDVSRRKLSTIASMNSDGASSSGATYLNISPAGKKSEILEMLDFPSSGLSLSVERFTFQLSGEGNHLDALTSIYGIKSAIFSCQSLSDLYNDTSQIRNLLERNSECSYQFILSKFILRINLSSDGVSLYPGVDTDATNSSHHSDHRGSEIHDEGSESQIFVPDHASEIHDFSTTRIPDVVSGYYLLVDICLSEISVSAYCMERLAKRQPYKQAISLIIRDEHNTVNCNIQAGHIFIESSALAVFAHFFQAYFLLISNYLLLLEDTRESFGEDQSIIGTTINFSSSAQATGLVPIASSLETHNTFNWIFLQGLTVILSQFSVILASKYSPDSEIQELTVEADMRLDVLTSESKLLFDLNRLAVFTQHLEKSTSKQSNNSRVPHFNSNTFVAPPSPILSESQGVLYQRSKSLLAGPDDAHTLKSLTSQVVNDAYDSSYPVNYILKHMSASIKIEKSILRREVGFLLLESDWLGGGSISGVDLTLTLYDIQMISSLLEPLSGTSDGKDKQDKEHSVGSRTSERNVDQEHTIPDGAIVAIKDLHEHMYFSVEAVNNQYRVVGVLHYTLVGEKALFRVKYHTGWGSQVSRISLISLFAKNNLGEPLRLNFSSGSGFVEISSSDDKRQALWQTYPYVPKSSGDGDDLEYYNRTYRKAFHLVNQKNYCAIAFVNGLPEFVKRPGNPFKAKVFNGFSVTNDGKLNVSNALYGAITDATTQEGSPQVAGEASEFHYKLPHINITIDKIALTLFHKVSDANRRIPILRGSIDGINIIGQIISSKYRIISSFNVGIQYMDAERNFWKDIVSPICSSLFFRYRLSCPDIDNAYQRVPAHLFFSLKQVDISLTEISLDVLLYVVGKLNIAGPYTVRTSRIFPNCCKLENGTGLGLLCNFPNYQDVQLTGRQSTSIFLRAIGTVDNLQESESTVSVCLSKHGIFSTSPINVSMSNSCLFSWRTRAVSLRDSRSFPGPFIVVEVSQKTEDGLCIGVSPLLRICNESGFSLELRFRRPQETGECATILLKHGDTVDDSMAVFDALELSGAPKRALMSLAIGNFLLSVRPEITEIIPNNGESVSIEWSEDLQGVKALRISGVFDKLNYKFRKAIGVESAKSFFSSLCCPLVVEGQHISDLYFLVQSNGRDVPVMQPQTVEDTSEIATSPVAMQVQKEISIYPTVQVYNLLQSEILVQLTENHPDLCRTEYCNYIGKQATIPCGSSSFLYANPAMMYFTVTLTSYSSRCKTVSSADWVKKLHEGKNEVHHIDTELNFGSGKYFAFLRLSRADKGFLEVTIFTSYMFQNNSELPLLCVASKQKHLPLEELRKHGSNVPPELGCFLPPKSTRSWFVKSSKVHICWLEKNASVALLDLDILSGSTEICLEIADGIGFSLVTKLGVSLQPCVSKPSVPSQVICFVPRYVIANESKEPILVRQCYLQDEMGEISTVEGKQRLALEIRNKTRKDRDKSFLGSLKSHRNSNENSQHFIQFCLKDAGFSWSGPVCLSSLGRFFLKFKRPSESLADTNLRSWKGKKSIQFALVEVIEEWSSLVLRFYIPANVALPYRIENCLSGFSVLYYQKDLVEADTLKSGDSVEYVWDDLNLPHKLVVEVIDLHLVREINIDKMCSWKLFFKMRQHKRMFMDLPLSKGFALEKRSNGSHEVEVFKVGYEVYADGPTRVLRICEYPDSYKEVKVVQPSTGFEFRVSNFTVQLLEKNNQDVDDASRVPTYSTFIVARLEDVYLGSLSIDRFKYYCISVQSLSIDEKWRGAPFASMLRGSQLCDSGSCGNILHIAFVLLSNNATVKEVKYSSIILQPINLKVDEETLMKLVPFWRTSLNTSRTQSRQFYFKHFEIHPIKITASFLPGNPYSSYTSAQEALRSLLHGVIKVPAVSNKVVELNGILLTHAFVTSRELLIKCAQHYSWYVVRAIYIAKGSPLLPPAFASIFDDTASSSLDVFFDPSDGSVSLPGLTVGMFKFISKCIDSKGFSGTKRYFGDLGKTIRTAGSNALFAAGTEISDSILKGAEANGFNGMVNGFHQGILRLAMEPSFLGAAVLEGGPDRKIKLDHSPGVDEMYIEGYLQAMLDVKFNQEYLRVRVVDNQVVLKNLPPNSTVINEIMENVKSFLVSKALLKGDSSVASRPFRHLRTESEWRIGPTVLTLCEHLFVSFTIRMLRKQANRFSFGGIGWKWNRRDDEGTSSEGSQWKLDRKWAVSKFVFSCLVAYVDGRLCRNIPNPIARRIVSGFLLSFLDNEDRK